MPNNYTLEDYRQTCDELAAANIEQDTTIRILREEKRRLVTRIVHLMRTIDFAASWLGMTSQDLVDKAIDQRKEENRLT